MSPSPRSRAKIQMRSKAKDSQGVALIIVLAMLVILSGVLVAFMSTAMTERTASQITNDRTAARQIADSTVNLVMAQIREATTQENEEITWASQPGAIRTFSGKLGGKTTLPNGASGWNYNSGANDYVYKLYSADRMKVKAAEYDNSELKNETALIESWERNKPEEGFVDLNEPIIIDRPQLGTGVVEPHYPIIDPRAKFKDKGETPNGSADPGIVDGFDAKTIGLLDNDLRMPGGGGVPYLPMPVKWLYVMKDGTIGKASEATKKNPIVGRTAFWVDDESCKLNINTASEGTFWDTPTISSERESGSVAYGSGVLTSSPTSFSLAAAQPTRGEYQRYAGHPATTCLSPVLGWLWDVAPTTPLRPKASPNYLKFKEAIYQIAPFLPYGKGTSMGGTRNADLDVPLNQEPKLNIARKALYTNVDGMLFTPQRFTLDRPQLNAPLNPEALEKVRFFLTATSRAPEINLFGRPRVTIWPVNDNPKYRTHFDDLFAFTSTLGGNITDPASKKYFLSRTEAKDSSKDYLGIARNRQLMDYLTWVTDHEIPGFGGSFRSKYSFSQGNATERDQILTEIFDYMRTVNLVDTGTRRTGAAGFQPYTPFFGLGQAGYGGVSERSFDWSGQVTPIKIGATAGMGRFFTVSEAALMFYRAGVIPPAVSGQAQKQSQMQAILMLEMATPMAGYPAIRETYWTRVSATPSTVTPEGGVPTPLNLCSDGNGPKPMINVPNIASHEVSGGRGFMPTLGVATAFHYYPENLATTDPAKYPNDPARNRNTTINVKNFTNKSQANFDGGYKRNVTVTNYPYVSDLIPLGKGNRFTMQPVSFTVEIFSGESPQDPRSQLVQTIAFTFPQATLLIPDGEAGKDVSIGTRFSRPINKDNNADSYIRSYDTVRSLELVGGGATPGSSRAGSQAGDIRLAMARTNVPEWFFQPRGGMTMYQNQSLRSVHGLQRSHGDPLTGYWPTDPGPNGKPTRGRLAMGSYLRGSKPPILPADINGVRRADNGPGDWDRGLSKHIDGALANKVDEGNVFFNYTDTANRGGGRMPYYRGRGIEEVGQSFFTPNRQLPSAVMLGSLPTGVLEGKPWQTLLFRPDRENGPGHPGGKIPPDHLLLDLFHLPIVEPYAISEPFSTAGKVNLNYVIAPFGYAKGDPGMNIGTQNPRSYIRRDTALRGVLKSAKITAIRTSEQESGHREDPLDSASDARFDIDLNKTLQQVEDRLKDPTRGLFRSASEICDVDLYPGGSGAPAVSTWGRFWDVDFAMTGDNQRERPYAHLYPRLTTKSNVFTIHMRCQAVRKSPNTKPDEFDERRDAVVSEYRGSATVERFVDPNDPGLRNYDEKTQRIDPYYRYRIVTTKQFTPR